MSQAKKHTMLEIAKKHVIKTGEEITTRLSEILQSIEDLEYELRTESSSQRIIKERLLFNLQKRVAELEHLKPSPYFFRCDVIFDDQPHEEKTIYFAKFQLSESSIFSWTSRASAIRFEEPGRIQYQLKDNTWRKGELLRKDQFMIVNGRIMFMASESVEYERTLIHQEKLQRKKNDFVLPEIIELMEKAQDTVIRAHYKGPFLISGPAGSGKTTLALHRVAYLLQSPDTMEQFAPQNIIVFVQDQSTKRYFGHLLDDLGAAKVTITTFPEWVFEKLQLQEYTYTQRIGDNQNEKDFYEYAKSKALQDLENKKYKFSENYFSILDKVYNDYFSEKQKLILKEQQKRKQFDRFDITILLQFFIQKNNGLVVEQEVYEQLKNGKYRKRTIQVQQDYSLIVLDEIQNYIAQQVSLLRGLVKEDTSALIYVGDLRQQTHLCTINTWQEVGEHFDDGRVVELNKVYRNTQNILRYINELGYNVDIPPTLEKGSIVQEKILNNNDELNFIKNELENIDDRVIGILAKYEEDLDIYKSAFADNDIIKIMTINDAQGVEFDTVFLVRVQETSYTVPKEYSGDLAQEVANVNKDLIYVALTRAMNHLYVLGDVSLQKLMKFSLNKLESLN